jgi:hypothetical protein
MEEAKGVELPGVDRSPDSAGSLKNRVNVFFHIKF